MSSEALAWAFKQDVKPSSAKFVLVAMAECAHYQTGKIFPSIAHLSEITGLNRKTIIASVASLERDGYIRDTGERAGTTGQIKVYQATIGTVPKTEQSQKRNSSTFTRKESQKRDTEPSREPSPSVAKATSGCSARKAAFDFPLPEGVDPIDWDGLKQNRKAKRAPLTEGAHRQIVKKLDAWQREGWPPGPIVAFAVERGWTTIFETDEMKNGRTNQSNFAASNGAGLRGNRPDPALDMWRQANAELAAEAGSSGGEEDYFGTWAALPALGTS